MRRSKLIRLISLSEITEPLSHSTGLKSLCVSLFFILLMVSLSPWWVDTLLCPLCVAETEKVGRVCCYSVTKSCQTLLPHGLQHARLPCPSLSARVCSNSSSLTRCCCLIISFSVTSFSSCPQSFPASTVFSKELAFRIRWPKCWSFHISLSNEYSGFISFKIDWFDLLAVPETLKSLL